MAKLRVHELAKELNINSKDIITALQGTEYEVKTSNNSIDDNAQSFVRKKLNKSATAQAAPAKAAAPAAKSAAPAKTEAPAKPEAPVKAENAEPAKPKKKPSISAVFNPQNSKNGNHRQRGYHTGPENRQPAAKPAARPQETVKPQAAATGEVKPATAEVKTEAAAPVQAAEVKPRPYNNPRPQGERPYNNPRPQGERPYNNPRPQGERPYNNPRPQGDRPYNNPRPQGDRPYNNPRPQGDRPYNNNRPQGDRPYNNNRPQGDRPYNNNRPQGDRPYNNNRPQGDRPYNNTNRPQGDRPYNNTNRPQGDRPYNNNRPQGDRPYNNNRPQGGGYNNNRPQGGGYNNNRPQGGGYNNNRPGGYNNAGRPGAPTDAKKSTPEEMRTKESRERNNRTNQNKGRNNQYDKLGSKRQEHYVNLEKNGGKKKRPQQPQPVQKEEDTIKEITLPEFMTIRELADKMKIQPSAIVKKLFLKGEMVTVNQEVNYEKAEEIALEFNCIASPEVKVDVIAELLKEDEEDEATLVARPPVVCVMGHVDHGKTSLLDAIRDSHVTDREAGGITQHIGASVVNVNGQKITFLDTPGHEAFTAMRMRGAKSTDIAILVVAADDGVMPQTIEAINHAKAAEIEIVVAINKIDKPNANIERVKQELSEYELIPEDWGGSTVFVPVSAHTHEGIEQLMEMILLTAEVLELKANPDRTARGVVIEAQLDKGRGAVATVLVQKGTLHVGEPIACGSAYGKVRAMIDDKGRRLKEAGPSTPVEILGLSSVPDAGETFVACENEKDARSFSETYISEGKNRLLEDTRARMSLDDLFSQIQSGNVKELNIIVKADVQGSVEAVKQSLMKLSNEEVVVKIIHGGVGAINESDVILASASNAIIIGFNVRPDPTAKVTAENEGVDVRLYKVIYNAIEDVEAAMKGMLDPIFEEKVLGHAEVRQIFKASGIGNIAGSYVLDGTFERGCKVRISREGKQIFEGDLASLKRFKDDVKEVKTGFECGLVFDGFSEIEELDIVEAYKMVEVAR